MKFLVLFAFASINVNCIYAKTLCEKVYVVNTPSVDGVQEGGTFYLDQRKRGLYHPRKGYLPNLMPVIPKQDDNGLLPINLKERKTNKISEYIEIVAFNGAYGFIKLETITRLDAFLGSLATNDVCNSNEINLIAPKSPFEDIRIKTQETKTSFSRSALIPVLLKRITDRGNEVRFLDINSSEEAKEKDGIIYRGEIEHYKISNETFTLAKSIKSSEISQRSNKEIQRIINKMMSVSCLKKENLSYSFSGDASVGSKIFKNFLGFSGNANISNKISYTKEFNKKILPESYIIDGIGFIITNEYQCEEGREYDLKSKSRIELKLKNESRRLPPDYLDNHKKMLTPFKATDNDPLFIKMKSLKTSQQQKEVGLDYFTIFYTLKSHINNEFVSNIFSSIPKRRILTNLLIEKMIDIPNN